MNALTSFSETADIETSSEDYARRFAGAIGAWFLTVQAQATLALLAAHPGATILDVGGGHGQLTGTLLANGYAVTVLGSAEQCRARIDTFVKAGQCAFKVGDILDLPYPDRAFDVVISYRLLPHVSNWQPYLAELSRVARIAVLLDFPTQRSINAIAPYLFAFKKRVERNTRTYTCFDEEELIRIFRSHGLVFGGRYAQFFLPMVLYRMLKAPRIAAAIEATFRHAGLTGQFGSPVILKLMRDGE